MFDVKNKQLDSFDTKKIVKNSGTYIILGVAILAMTFFGVCDPGGNQSSLSGIAAEVNGDEIDSNEFRRSYSSNYDRFAREQGEKFDPAIARVAQKTIDQLIQGRVQYHFAMAAGISVGDDEVTEYLADLDFLKDEQGNFSRKAYKNYLNYQRFTEKSLMETVRRELAVTKMRNLIFQSAYVSSEAAKLDWLLNESKLKVKTLTIDPQQLKLNISQKEVSDFIADEKNEGRIKAFYDSRSSEYNKPEKRKARHILISYKGARSATGDAASREKAAAQKLAEEVLLKVKAPGAKFEDLAKQYTDEPAGKTKGGDLGEFKREDMVKEFSDAAFAMNAGDISEVVESPFGFHIIKVERKIAAINKPLESVKTEIARKILEDQKRPELLGNLSSEILEKLKKQEDVSSILAANNLTWKTSQEFGLMATSIPGVGGNADMMEAVLKLDKDNKVAPEAYDVSGKKVLVQFESFSKAGTDKVDEEKIDMSKSSSVFNASYQIFSTLNDQFKERLDEKGKIWRNQEFLALDDRQTTQN